MQSRERLLTPPLKYFALALAHGILESSSAEYYEIALKTLCYSSLKVRNWPVSSSEGSEFGLSLAGRHRVIKNPLNLEFNLPRGQESASLVHPEPKVAPPVIHHYVVTVLPVLHSVFRQEEEGKDTRQSKYMNMNLKMVVRCWHQKWLFYLGVTCLVSKLFLYCKEKLNLNIRVCEAPINECPFQATMHEMSLS